MSCGLKINKLGREEVKVLRTPGSETCKEERIEWRGYGILWFALTVKELRTVEVGEGERPIERQSQCSSLEKMMF